MQIIITKWGILSFNPQLKFYVNWAFITDFIQNQPYIISKPFFLALPHMFRDSYVIFVETGIKSEKDVKKLIKKLEQIEDIKIPEETQAAILDAAEDIFSLAEDE